MGLHSVELLVFFVLGDSSWQWTLILTLFMWHYFHIWATFEILHAGSGPWSQCIRKIFNLSIWVFLKGCPYDLYIRVLSEVYAHLLVWVREGAAGHVRGVCADSLLFQRHVLVKAQRVHGHLVVEAPENKDPLKNFFFFFQKTSWPVYFTGLLKIVHSSTTLHLPMIACAFAYTIQV